MPLITINRTLFLIFDFSINSNRPELLVDNTLDLMEELLGGVTKEPSSGINAHRGGVGGRESSFGSKKSQNQTQNNFDNLDNLINPKKPETVTRTKSRLSSSDLDDLLGIPEKTKLPDNLDDLLKIE